jgi:hypothetical protein
MAPTASRWSTAPRVASTLATARCVLIGALTLAASLTSDLSAVHRASAMASLANVASARRPVVASTLAVQAFAPSSRAIGARLAGPVRMTATAARKIGSVECRLLSGALMMSR